MALSNKFGWLVLTTGNKSEYSVGYTTLYGDMAGGFGVLKDVPKTLVYRLAHYRNSQTIPPVIPPSIIERPPSAELKPGPARQDSLPPYDLLDAILEAYVEEDQGRDQLIRRGMPEQVVDQVIRMVDRAEYKRRQAPPGIKISPKAFGRDRRLPITNRFGGLASRALRHGRGPAIAGSRTAIVARTRAQRRPSSSVISTSQIQAVRPRLRDRARCRSRGPR